ncbi:hypothetical protein ACOCJ5_05330 [Knoellia sp. CPCC 206450]|uniref:hypothetical protein n=1 Tax=Knoellia tibetensis TaxID=3404798 RepID=UPI003B43B241
MAVGRQIPVFTHPDDVGPLVDEMSSTLDARVLPWKWLHAVPPTAVPDEAERFALLAPARGLSDIHPRQVRGREEWLADAVRDPVVEWRRSRLDEGCLYVGRFYYVPVREDGSPKDDAFLDFATSLFGWLKRHLRTVDIDGRRILSTPTASRARATDALSLSLIPK